MKQNYNIIPKAGEIWLANIPNAIEHQQGGIRPVLITTNNMGNLYSPVCEGIPFTTQNKKELPTHVFYKKGEAGLAKDCILLAEQKWTINKTQLIRRIGLMNKKQIIRAVTAVAYANPIYLLAFKAGVQNTDTFKKLAMCH